MDIMEPMLMILPPPCRFMTGWQARLNRKALVRLVSKTWCHFLRARLSSGFLMLIPAFMMSMCRRPKRVRVALTRASTEASSSTFTSMASACAPRSRNSATAFALFSRLRAATTTAAPASASPRAMPSPMPPFPPVTTATRPFRSNAPTRRFPLDECARQVRVRGSVTARRNPEKRGGRRALRLLVLVRVADGEPGRRIPLDTVGRHGIAQAVLRQGGEAVDHLGEVAWRQGHEHLVVGDPAIASLGIAGNRQGGLVGLERLAPGVRASRLPHRGEGHLLVARPLEPVDHEDHLPWGAVQEADVGRVESIGRERGDGHGLVATVGDAVHGVLMQARVLLRLEPHPGHALAGEPLLVLGMEADHRSALRAHQVLHGDPYCPAELTRLGHDLIRGVLGARPADLRNSLHLRHRLEELHADGNAAQPQVLREAVDDGRPVVRLGAQVLISSRVRMRRPASVSRRARHKEAWRNSRHATRWPRRKYPSMSAAARRLPARIVHHEMVSRSQWASTLSMAKVNTSKQQNSMMNTKRRRGSRSAMARSPAAIQPKAMNAAPCTRVYSSTRGHVMTRVEGSRRPWKSAAPSKAGVRSGIPAAAS